ncbi:MAG TPA: endonuclease V [Candidatus Paceibacterota bacterium]|nr:endonuclease V [Candidatus Paceibacterota bacterium]
MKHMQARTSREAIALQDRLREELRIQPLPGLRGQGKPVTVIAGVDVSMERFGTELFAGVAAMTYPRLEPIGHAVVRMRIGFPYIPGLLSFREIPGLLACLEKLREKLGHSPDLIMVDGQGIAHPRRLGIAAHLGIVTGIPTIGCAKSRLYGSYEEPQRVGEASPVVDPKTGEAIGYALKSKQRANSLVISPGHMTSVDDALEVVRTCLRGYRLPEPTRLAHELVNRFRRGEISE